MNKKLFETIEVNTVRHSNESSTITQICAVRKSSLKKIELSLQSTVQMMRHQINSSTIRSRECHSDDLLHTFIILYLNHSRSKTKVSIFTEKKDLED